MRQGFTVVPFKVDDEHGLSETIGLAKFSAAGIVLEFEKEYLGMVKAGGVKEARIPLTEILDIEFGKGFLGTFGSINVRFRSLGMLEGIPTKKGKLKLKVARADRQIAIDCVENMKQRLADLREDVEPTSVRHLFGDESETKRLE